MAKSNPHDYTDKVVVLTGASSGFGRLAATRFLEQGARLALCDIDNTALQDLAGKLTASKDEVLARQCDVSNGGDVQTFFEDTVSHFGRIDVAINNAGVAHTHTPLADCDEVLWERTLSVNLTGVFLCLKRELNQMLTQGHGVILNIASVAGVLGAPMLGPYGASKHGVVGLTKTAAAEYGARGIRINALCPGYSRTPMVDAMIDAGESDLEDKMTDRIPLGRMATPAEVVDAMLWLCSERNGFMNGASILLDGGLTAC